MTVKNFIPEVWSARGLENLNKKLVFANCVNRNYEGEIKQLGDTVRVNRIGKITVKDYVNGRIDDPETITSEQLKLIIDKAKYFNFEVDDVDAAQANVDLIDLAMGQASVDMGDVIDTDLAGFVAKAGVTVGTDAAPISITVAEAYDALVDLATELNEQNVPKQDRFAVLPPWYFGLISKDPRFTKEYTILENGMIEGGKVAGFQLWESNNVVKKGNNYSIMAGSMIAITFAQQLVELKAYEPENSFSDAVKGLVVYGAEVFYPEALCKFVVSRPAKLGAVRELDGEAFELAVKEQSIKLFEAYLQEQKKVSENSAIQSAEVTEQIEQTEEKEEKDTKKKNKNEGK